VWRDCDKFALHLIGPADMHGTRMWQPDAGLAIWTKMKALAASKFHSISAVVVSLHLIVTTGCATIPQASTSIIAEPVLVDPLAIAERTGLRPAASQSEPTRIARLADQAWSSIDESFQNLFHGERVAAWDEWSQANLRDGDIVFLQSRSNWVWGVIELSRITQDVTDSEFTHVALAAIEDGDVVLYDIDMPGPGRTPFRKMMVNSNTVAVAVKRLRPEFQPYVPKAVQYCREVFASRLPFDKQLKLENDRLYCAELIEVAFRASGLELSQPTRWDALPGLDKHPLAVNTIAWANDLQPEEFVIVPGNDQIGIWASPGLELVLPLTGTKNPPGVGHLTRDAIAPERTAMR
jgi:hypothetical protein